MKKNIAILGSTGSIGQQALQVISENPEHFQVEVLTAKHRAELLISQAGLFRPNVVVIADETHYHQVLEALHPLDIKVYCGAEAITQIAAMETIDIVLNALVGYAGFLPTIQALKSGKTIALANKESLVVGGELVYKMVKEFGGSIIPVDSEHSAIYQCLAGESPDAVEKIILTASGGPFRNKSLDFLANVGREQALKHPNWEMGSKITIDSASMMNKGLEVIEAKWLFGIEAENIEVVVHPQSIIHSMVQFHDGSIKAQLGMPDMRLPIQFALSWPERLPSKFPRFSFKDYPSLTFEPPDTKIFRNLALAYEAIGMGGNACCVLNAANEEAVCAFLVNSLGFMQMPGIIEKCLEKVTSVSEPSLDDYQNTDRETRLLARNLIYGKY